MHLHSVRALHRHPGHGSAGCGWHRARRVASKTAALAALVPLSALGLLTANGFGEGQAAAATAPGPLRISTNPVAVTDDAGQTWLSSRHVSGGTRVVTTAADPTTPAATTPTPAPLWQGDYETDNLSQFQNASWNYLPAAPVVSTAHVRGGRYAARYTIPAGGSRCETVPLFRALTKGDDLYFAVSTYLEPGFPVNTGWQVLTQWKNDGTGSPPLELTVRENSSVFRVDGGYGYPSGPRMSGQDVGPVVTGQWIDWVFHIRFSSDPSVGSVDVWRNGAPVMSGFHPLGGTLYPGLNSYLKNGYYRSGAITTDGHVWEDNVRVGTSYSSVSG